MSNHNIFEQKEILKKEHQRIQEQHKTARKQKETQLLSKKAAFQHLKKQLDAKERSSKELQAKVNLFQRERNGLKQFVSKFQALRSEKEQIFNTFAKQEKAISAQISQLEKESRALKQKYQPNKSYQATAQAQAEIGRVDQLDAQIKKLNISLAEAKKNVEAAASQVEKVGKEKKGTLNEINQLVKKQEKAIQDIKDTNEAVNSLKRKIVSNGDELKKLESDLAAFDEQNRRAIVKSEDAMSYLPYPEKDQTVYISPEGLDEMMKNFDPNCPERGFFWTNDYRTQLPIFLKKKGLGAQQPRTIGEMWQQILHKYGNHLALTFEVAEDKWKSITYKEYYAQSVKFGKACISYGITEYTPIMIMGFNSKEWAFSFFGSIFARYLPIGMYTTNGPETCEYIANHCEGQVVVLQDKVQLQKYYGIIDQCPKIKYFVLYKDQIPSNLPPKFKGKVLLWDDFLKAGQKFKPTCENETMEYRLSKQKPGNCATFIYTSGTTGMPKAVMVSHDGYIFLLNIIEVSMKKYNSTFDGNGGGRILSYLPLSHAAAQIIDLMMGVYLGANVFFAAPTVMQGTMPKYLLACRPTLFLGVPRVWEKLEERLTQVISTTTGVKKKLLDWAMSIGIEGTFAQIHGKPTPRFWGVAKRLFNKIKSALGMELCQTMITGAAPMRQSTRKFFLQINISFFNGYGMSETSGPHTVTDPQLWDSFSPDYLRQTGNVRDGLQVFIQNEDREGKGQICMRGRNRFMGYFKNEEENKKTIDRKGFVHSGDEGKIDKNGTVYITGRIKELIITAGGQNIPPVLIQNQIIKEVPVASQVIVIGDMKKYLSCLITLKTKGPTDPSLADEVVSAFAKEGSTAKTIQDIIKCPKVNNYIKKGIEQANKKAISNAQRVQRHTILPGELTIDSGAMTPTMKYKRKVIHDLYKAEIQSMYIDSKL